METKPLAVVKPISRKFFYDHVRTNFIPNLKPTQIQGFEAIFNEWEKHTYTDLRWLAYMLGTVYHETGHTMQPVPEAGKGKGRPYGKKLKMGKDSHGNHIPYTIPDQIYYGRGLVQLTWYENYQMMMRLIGVDLLNKPELALQMDISVKILFEGMLRGASSFGDFTGKCLEQYFTPTIEDWEGARKIINGTDQAKRIAEYGIIFFKGLKLAA